MPLPENRLAASINKFQQQFIMRSFSLAIGISLVALLAGGDDLCAESIADPDIAIESARDGLNGGLNGGLNRKNWYDSARDEIRPLTLPKPKVNKKQPQAPRSSNRSGFWDWLNGWLTGINPSLTLAGVLKFLAWTALAIVLVFLVWWLIRVYQRNEKKKFTAPVEVDPRATSIDQIEALPIDVKEDISDLLAAARRHYQSGDLAMAIVYLFSHQLIELDKHHLIRLVKGKTNRQYLREVKRNAAAYPELPSLARETVALFEEVFFGKRVPSQSAVASCWNQVDRFDSLVKQAARQEEQI